MNPLDVVIEPPQHHAAQNGQAPPAGDDANEQDHENLVAAWHVFHNSCCQLDGEQVAVLLFWSVR